MKRNKLLKIVLILTFFIVPLISAQNQVAAKVYYGNGNLPGGVSRNCSTFEIGYTHLCGPNNKENGDGSNGGGASWHIYSTNSSIIPQDNNTILKGNPKITASTIKSSICGNQEWYMAYGWDGRDNKTVTGPLGHKVLFNGRTIPYNNYGSITTLRDLRENIAMNNHNGAKIAEDLAKEIYHNETGENLADLDPRIGFFCVTEDSLVEKNKYYSQSNAGGKNGYALSQVSQENANPTNLGTIIYAPSISVEVGEPTPINFSHNIYAKEEQPNSKIAELNTKWYLYRMLYNGDRREGENLVGNGGFVHDDILSLSGKEVEPEGIVLEFNEKVWLGSTMYAPKNRPYSDGENSYIARDTYQVTFKKEGTYTLCEQFHIQENEKPTTTACIVVNVGSYFTKSNVAVQTATSGKNVKSTDFASGPTNTRTDNTTINADEKAYITFSHNIYSSSKQDSTNKEYRIVRTVNGSPGINSNEYIISESSKVKTGQQSGNVGAETTGTINEFKTKKGNDPYYIGGPRDYTDGNPNNNYVLRDYYEITFPEDGIYDFCETVYLKDTVTGDYGEYSSACTLINVGGVDEPPSDPTNVCSTWVPSSYNNSDNKEGWTSVIAAVKKSNKSWVKNSEDIVWARPTEKIDWKHCYFPGVQKVAFTIASPEHKSHSGQNNTNGNKPISSWGTWNNYFKVTQNNQPNRSKTLKPQTVFPTGNSDIKEWGDLQYEIPTGDYSVAGKTLTETNTSSSPIHAKVENGVDCPEWCCQSHTECTETCDSEGENCSTTCETICDKYCHHTDEYIANSRTPPGPTSETATVKVPYNFNITDVQLMIKNNEVVFAGETVTIDNAKITVGTRQNNTTGGSYATKAPSELHLIAYTINSDTKPSAQKIPNANSGDCNSISDKEECSVIATDSKSLNYPENIRGSNDTEFEGKSYNVFDVPAGTWYCVVAATYPSSSGDDKMMEKTGNDKWFISEPDCKKVAKRPSLQIWGASLYSAGEIQADPSIKRVVDGIYSFEDGKNDDQANSTKNQTVFGSWAEYSITTKGKNSGSKTGYVGGIASGASTGAPGNIDRYGSTFSPNATLGGSHEGNDVSLCKHRSPLTIPNNRCGFTESTYSTIITSPTNKSSFLANFTKEENGTYTYQKYDSTGDFISSRAENGSEDGSIIKAGETYVIEPESNNDNFTVDEEIRYEDTTYTTTAEIPKFIIHAKNIYINCNIRQIDAVLIADETVYTCADENGNSPDDNSRDRSVPLKIFGTVITNKLVAGRTYGAATGVYSTIPAEIIDYDTSLYLWGMPRANTDTSGKTTTTYQTELAPRL